MVDTLSESIGTNAAAGILRDSPAQAEEEVEAQEAEQEEAEELTPSEDAGDEAGEEAEAEAEEIEQEEEDPRYTVKIHGTEQEVTLSELLSGYQRQDDYTRKTMEVADTRKKFDSAVEDVSRKRQELVSRLDVMGEALGNKAPFSQDEIDKAKADGYFTESTRMFQENAEWKEHRQNITTQRDEALTEAREEAVKTFVEELPAAIPEWTDQETAKAESGEVYQYLKGQGYDDAWIGNLTDAKAVSMVRKAMLFDKKESGKPKALKKVAQAPRMQKPGSPRPKSQDGKDQEKKILKNVGESKGRAALKNAARFLQHREQQR